MGCSPPRYTLVSSCAQTALGANARARFFEDLMTAARPPREPCNWLFATRNSRLAVLQRASAVTHSAGPRLSSTVSFDPQRLQTGRGGTERWRKGRPKARWTGCGKPSKELIALANLSLGSRLRLPRLELAPPTPLGCAEVIIPNPGLVPDRHRPLKHHRSPTDHWNHSQQWQLQFGRGGGRHRLRTAAPGADMWRLWCVCRQCGLVGSAKPQADPSTLTAVAAPDPILPMDDCLLLVATRAMTPRRNAATWKCWTGASSRCRAAGRPCNVSS